MNDAFEPDGPEPPSGCLVVPPEGLRGKTTAGRLFPFCKCASPEPDGSMSFGDDPYFKFCRVCKLPMEDGRNPVKVLSYSAGHYHDSNGKLVELEEEQWR